MMSPAEVINRFAFGFDTLNDHMAGQGMNDCNRPGKAGSFSLSQK